MTGGTVADHRSNRVLTTVIVACALVVVAVFVFFRTNWHLYSIPAASMEPTILVGDHMLAENGPFRRNEIGRGEVIVFLTEGNVNFVKRVIGIGGDRVRMVDGKVVLNGEALATEAMGEYETENHFGRKTGVPMMRETLDGRSYETLDMKPDSAADNTELFVVPEDHVFVLGDNRDNSSDSRFQIGFVPVERIVGIARTIYWSPKRGGLGPFPVR
jgi:signal peptidase I